MIKREGKRVTMVVIYDRFVFFSVEKFFIPLLYSCLNILVQSMKGVERVRMKTRENVWERMTRGVEG